MFRFLGALVRLTIALVLLVPAAILLVVLGLPVGIVVCVLAVPVIIVLAVIGLPILIIAAVAVGLLGAVFGVLAAFVSVGVVALKVAIVILVPLLILAWIGKRIVGVPVE